jgi:hypothetical protein
MKRLLLILFVSSVCFSAFPQMGIPAKVKKTFKAQYPSATETKWISKGDRIKEWRAMYKLDGVLHTSWYDHKGNWEVTKSKIDQSELPQAVLKSIEDDYYGYEIMITARFENPEQKGYEVWLDNGREGFDVQFSPEGKILLRTLTSNGYKPIDEDGNFIEK